jgi:TetR/AcrR family transcriptional regulator
VVPVIKVNEARASALRERILQGAAAAFGRLGYAATRVEDILAETAISRPTFYKVYDSKDAVFLALSERHHHAIRERLRDAVASSEDPIVQHERCIEAFLRWRAQLGPLGRVLDVEARAPGSRLRQHRARTLRLVLELTQAGIASIGRPPVDPTLLRALIAAAECTADELFAQGQVSERLLQRAKAIVLRIHLMALLTPGDAIPPLPAPPRAASKR